MRMVDFVVKGAIIPRLSATTKEGVIREMVGSLRDACPFDGADPEELVKAVLKREQIASTGIGRGVAIPHAKHEHIESLICTVALSPAGVKFDSLDGEPVHIFVLLISRNDKPGDHLRALEKVSRILRDDNLVKQLRQATTVDRVWEVLEQADDQQPS
jgi:PTS system fructose-specific IIA component/PTS system nitrogen regulatory IIA component